MDDLEVLGTRDSVVSNNSERAATEGLEQICLSGESDGDQNEEDAEGNGVNEMCGCKFDEETAVNGLEDLWEINFKDIGVEDLMRYHFPDVGVAFMFYNWYASMHGFAARKSKIHRNKEGEATQQTFLCYRQGYREDKFTNSMIRKRHPKPHTRCGCEAKCKVHIEVNSGRWYIRYVNDVHNHNLLPDKFTSMLPAHRKMSEYDILQMNLMRNVGIPTSNIYGFIASQAGGYENVGFRKRDMYNQQERQRQPHFSDAKAALAFIERMRSSDEMMFWRHIVDDEGRLERLFWCDGTCRRDYSVFGDVLAFDATYRKNKYLCPLVVFSGVNHHNQSIVFASAIVGNETEETYVWLLEQFLAAMSGKSPSSVITDGDVAMRNAIRRVFPNAHHRLCAWHLLRNAATNVSNPKFVSKFRQCMLGDYDVGEFKRRWDKMVKDFSLEDNKWVREMYQKRKMWATAHIRGNFFAGFRTTSRCEGLHAVFGRFVNFKNNLLEFVQQFHRCLNFMRYKEVEADFESLHGDPIMQTQLLPLERSAADLYTKEVFLLIRPVLERACTCRVVGCKQTATTYIYTVSKYLKEGLEWHVSFCPSSLIFKCSCERFESLGIPCEHLVSVLVYLDIVLLPECVVLSRWTKTAKDGLDQKNSSSGDPTLVSQYYGLVERCKRMTVAAVECRRPQYIRSTVELITSHTKFLESIGSGDEVVAAHVDPLLEGTIRNPVRARSKGCGGGGASSSARSKGKQVVRKSQTCGLCKREGHNRKSCHLRTLPMNINEGAYEPNALSDNEVGDQDCDYENVDMFVD